MADVLSIPYAYVMLSLEVSEMTYWAEFGLADAKAWLRSSRKPGLHPITRQHFVSRALQCFRLYKRDCAL